MVRSMSALVSVMLAPPREARVCWKLCESEVNRYVTLMALALTPGEVAPPLFPEKEMQGGEYGSPATCGPAQAADLPGAVDGGRSGCRLGRTCRGPTRAPPVAPAPPAAPAAAAAAGTVVAVVEPAAADPAADWVSCTTSCCGAFVGTSMAMSTNATRSAASGPYPFSSRLLALADRRNLLALPLLALTLVALPGSVTALPPLLCVLLRRVAAGGAGAGSPTRRAPPRARAPPARSGRRRCPCRSPRRQGRG